MDIPTLIAILSFVAAIYGIYLNRAQYMLALRQYEGASASAKKTGRVTAPPIWYRTPTVWIVAILAVLAWVPKIQTLFEPQSLTMTGLGVSSVSPLTMQIAVNGSSISKLQSGYKIELVCFHYLATVDPLDAKGLQRSNAYEITNGPQILSVVADAKYIQEIQSGMRPTNYVVLAIPNSAVNRNFDTIREAQELGAIAFSFGAGPP